MRMEEVKKLRWGDLDDNDEDLDFLLPPTAKQVISPNDNGIKKVAEPEHKLKRAVERRSSWAKFGDAACEDGGDRLTVVSTEEILFERPRALGTKQDETKAQRRKGDVALMVCRSCKKKGDHWTARCPYKDLSQPSESFTDDLLPTETNATKGAYVPPRKRGGSVTTERNWRSEKNSVRVSNLSEETREADLLELFQPFGQVSRVRVPIDRKSGMSRDFGFVDFVRREDAERAIGKLDGYGYDNLILKLEWAT